MQHGVGDHRILGLSNWLIGEGVVGLSLGGEFWRLLELLWAWKSATYLYIGMVLSSLLAPLPLYLVSSFLTFFLYLGGKLHTLNLFTSSDNHMFCICLYVRELK